MAEILPEKHTPRQIPKSSTHSTYPIRLKRNVRIARRRTTVVLEPYAWDCIDAALERECLCLDEFCEAVDRVRIHSSLASAARMVVLAYFRILDGLHHPPFLKDGESFGGALHEPTMGSALPSVLPLAIRRFAQDEEHG